MPARTGATLFPDMQPLTAEQVRLVENNARLVAWVLNKQRTPERQWDDAYQDGMFGLMRAAQRFDPTLGYQFSTYATVWVRQAVISGRGIAGGINERRGQRVPGSYSAPMSLNAEVGDAPLSDRLAGVEDPEREALDVTASAELYRRSLRAAKDGTDLTIVNGIAGGTTRAELALEVGISKQAISQRLQRLRSRMNHPTGRVGNGERSPTAC